MPVKVYICTGLTLWQYTPVGYAQG